MMYVDAKLFYRGTFPNKKYIRFLEQKFEMKFVTLELIEIKNSFFSYVSHNQISYIICPGNPNLSNEDKLFCSYIGMHIPVCDKWNLSIYCENHQIYCKKGDYQVLTYENSSALLWFLKKIKRNKKV